MTLPSAATLDTGLGQRCRARARDEGPAAALDELRDGLGPSARLHGPGGHTLLPAGAPAPADATLLLTVATGTGDLAVRHDERLRDGGTGPVALGAAWIRLGLGERLLGCATAYLSGRTTGGEPLINVSAVRTMIGDAAADLAEARRLLEPDDGLVPEDTDAARAMAAVASAQRTALRLLGASGFLDEEPGRLGYVMDLLGDIFPTPEARA